MIKFYFLKFIKTCIAKHLHGFNITKTLEHIQRHNHNFVISEIAAKYKKNVLV